MRYQCARAIAFIMPQAIEFFKNNNVPDIDNEAIRVEAKRFYNSKTWKLVRMGKIRENPLCEKCQSSENLQVHHIQDRRLNPDLQYEFTNLQTLCVKCHAGIRNANNYWPNWHKAT